jgi:hypothetical protein
MRSANAFRVGLDAGLDELLGWFQSDDARFGAVPCQHVRQLTVAAGDGLLIEGELRLELRVGR